MVIRNAITVTDEQLRPLRQPDTRNGGPWSPDALWTLVERCRAQDAAADRLDPDRVARRGRIRQAERWGKSCAGCGRSFQGDELVARVRYFETKATAFEGMQPRLLAIAVTCMPCCSDADAGRAWLRCRACKQRVISAAGIDSVPARTGPPLCCLECRYVWRKAGRREAAQYRQRRCMVCTAPFTPARSDAQTCSPACRQKAYRLRQSDKSAAALSVAEMLRSYDDALGGES